MKLATLEYLEAARERSNGDRSTWNWRKAITNRTRWFLTPIRRGA